MISNVLQFFVYLCNGASMSLCISLSVSFIESLYHLRRTKFLPQTSIDGLEETEVRCYFNVVECEIQLDSLFKHGYISVELNKV